jgi:hypothetical protein
MITLDEINEEFDLTIDENQIDELATETFLDLQAETHEPNAEISFNDLHGMQAHELFSKSVFNKLMKQYLLMDLIYDSTDERELDSDRIQFIANSTKTQAQISKAIATLVAQKLTPTAKISESKLREWTDWKVEKVPETGEYVVVQDGVPQGDYYASPQEARDAYITWLETHDPENKWGYAGIRETLTAGAGGGSSIEANAPEHTIEIVNGDESKTLKERIELRKQLNKITEESLRLRNLREKANDGESDYSQLRYRLQKFTNGGTPYIDENGTPQIDGEKDGPSSYEAWRAGINNKKRDARIKLEKEDRNSPFASPRHTTAPDPKTVLDNQADEFLSWYINKFND